VRVKGKTEPVEIYELVGPGDPAGPAKLSGAQDYRCGFEAYRRGDFEAARAAFAALSEASPSDGAARLMLERSRRLAAQGAPAGWEGITEFHEK
ncbi:MAG TPA: adenylate/guanylate cyclase domain-containing protein, partial [Spirochaetia bacterium]|nr:adenylate/guanylate cyclase domain-containing protein [Spirochaetia bacterium]